MKFNPKILFLFILPFFVACFPSREEEPEVKATVNVYKHEAGLINFTTYFYEATNHTENDLIIDFVIEATCSDSSVYDDKGIIEVSAGKTRKSDSFFDTDGKDIVRIEVVDVKTMPDPRQGINKFLGE